MTVSHGARDPGLQPERTALAWSRTGIVTALLAVSAAGLALRRPSTEGLLVATLAALSTAVAAVLVVRTATAVSRHDLAVTRQPWSRLGTLATACALLAGAGTFLALAPAPA
ncbi:MAG TPA: DUF202 domain-containing protein [Jiangellales bacterium]|jgi:hypothetical protein|nr:DUF202 domain-containing protein [Jiangellales bacterium]